jgi:hypothetical protein
MLHGAGGITWTFDAAFQQWHERGTWDPISSQFVPSRARYHAFIFGQHRWLDTEGASVYASSLTVGTDVDGLAIRRVRRAPMLNSENRRLFFGFFELLLDSGLGLVTGQGSDPHVMMRSSNDSGKTWPSPESWRSAGKGGGYGKRVRWNRCGMGRQRVFEVAVSDPIPWRLVDAFLQVSPSTEVA